MMKQKEPSLPTPGDCINLARTSHFEKLSVGALCQRLGISRQMFYKLMRAESSITPRMALKLGALFGNSPREWLALQLEYDLRILAEQEGVKVEPIGGAILFPVGRYIRDRLPEWFHSSAKRPLE